MSTYDCVCAVYDCDTCSYRVSGRCLGCVPGNVELTAEGRDACRVYSCVTTRGITSCLECEEPACALRRNAESLCPLRSQFEKRRWWAGRLARAMETRGKSGSGDGDKTSEKIIGRLRWYLTALDCLSEQGCESVSSWQLAELVGTRAALIRKDLSRFGEFGTPSYGYKVDYLREMIHKILHLDRPRDLVWVGACAIRHYESSFMRLAKHNCSVAAVFDTDEKEVGTQACGFTVQPISKLSETLSELGCSAAAIAVGGSQAQEIARTIVDSGVMAILNMSGEMLLLPDHVRVTSFDIAGEIMELCYYCGEQAEG